ncbi:helix-turn-helix domain-containing protein [Paenibacillus sp. GCM10027628]|uniref:helix-turn-helix domain-containing protein n=1 Tax=Paenibacillus sp. GCM10027628 TaxID=3273413 RepID=UPI00363D60C3
METTLTMCVIDDIKAVVNGIANKIPWAEHGIRIVGTALDGAEGLRLIRELKPNIVITDIRMPKLGGIEMVKVVAEESPMTKIIFISGFTDFAYVQEAVRLGAFDYLLKPFTPGQIVEAVMKAKQATQSERNQFVKMQELEKKVLESRPYLRQEYVRSLLRYEANLEVLGKCWEFLNMEMAQSPLSVMVVEIDHFQERSQALPIGEVELIRFAVQNILEETLFSHSQGIVIRENSNQFVVVFNPPSRIQTTAMLELCRSNVEKYTKQTISMGLGMEVDVLQNIHISFEQAKTALSYNFYSGGNSVIPFSELTIEGPISPRYSLEKEKELFYALRSGNKSKAGQILEDLFLECSQYPVPPEPNMMMNLFYGLSFSMYRVLSEHISEEERIKWEASLAEMKGDTSLTMHGWMQYVRSICSHGCELMERRQSKDARYLIMQAKAYIETHLLSNLTVQECAKAVHLSPSYFANLFKKETGSTLMQYVTQQRMERAKEMLISGMQVQEISLVLGYEDRPYFSELFKKHSGMTPTDFRQLYMGNAEKSKK